jgi:hypothetical protein
MGLSTTPSSGASWFSAKEHKDLIKSLILFFFFLLLNPEAALSACVENDVSRATSPRQTNSTPTFPYGWKHHARGDSPRRFF